MTKKIITYIVLSYSFTWLLWLPLLLNKQFNLNIPIFGGQFFVGSFGPLFGAFVTTLIYDGINGFKSWIEKIYSLPKDKNVWLYALGLPILYLVVSIILQKVFLGYWPDFNTFGQTAKLPGFTTIQVLLTWILTFGLGEESGWRGFLLEEFQKKNNLLKSSLLVAIIWMLWHLPAFFFNPTYTEMGFGIIGWAIGLSYGSILLAWLARKGNYSVLPLLVWHGLFNLITAGDNAGEMMAMVASMIVIIHGIILARQLHKENI